MSDAATPAVSVQAIETSPVVRTLEIEVAPGRVKKAFDRAYRDLAKQAKVRGFRPGKAPRSVLEKLYGASLVEEIERTLVGETLAEAVDQSGVVPVAEPTIEADPPSPGEAFRYKASVEVKPSIALPELVGLPASRPVVEVADGDVEQELETLRQRGAEWVAEAEGTEAADGTRLTIDYRGTIEGEPFEGGTAEGAFVELGNDHYIPGFADQLQGATAAEEREIRVTFPDDYAAEDVRGKDAVFAATVQKLERQQVPELDDAFAAGLGDDEVQTLDALRENVRGQVQKRQEAAAEEEARRTLMDALIERTEFEVPPGLVERRLSQRLEAAHQQLAQFMPHDEIHGRLGQWREEWRPEAEREVRETLLLEAVASERSIEASDEDVTARIEEMARDQGMAADRLRSAYEERGLISSLGAHIAEQKALEFLLAEAKVAQTAGT